MNKFFFPSLIILTGGYSGGNTGTMTGGGNDYADSYMFLLDGEEVYVSWCDVDFEHDKAGFYDEFGVYYGNAPLDGWEAVVD